MTNDSILSLKLDEYRLISQLGRGGMARVYLALDEQLNRYAAIKVIDKPLRADSDYVTRFEQEAQTIAQLDHPHIVRLYRYGEASGIVYMAMQYIEGSDLNAMLASYQEDGEFIGSEEASRIVREICNALDYAHNRGIIHRDLKPSNIMLNKEGQAFLADFGLSLYTAFDTRGEVFGTPQYMAPEQVISSMNVVPQSDLYAVGVIIYEMFTGQVPFDAGRPLDTAELQITEPPPSPREIRAELDPAIEAVILKALSKEPEDRYPSGVALADALDLALDAAISPPATLLRLSIPQRVMMMENSLPPLPAAIIPPAAIAKSVSPSEQADSPAAVPTSKHQFLLPHIQTGMIFTILVILLSIVAYFLFRGTSQNEEANGIAVGDEVVATSMPNETLLLPTPTLAATATGETLIEAKPEVTSSVVPTVPQQNSLLANVYDLLIVRNRNRSMFVVNLARGSFPLTGLYLQNEKGELRGEEWALTSLPKGACATIWDRGGDPKPPSVMCDQVGNQLTREGDARFWNEGFNVFYDDEWVGYCQKEGEPCFITVETDFPLNVVTEEKDGYHLLFAKNREHSLFVVNLTVTAFPIEGLYLSNKDGAITAEEWEITSVPKGTCVTAWENSDGLKPPSITCTEVGNRLTREGKSRFWKEGFDVFYQDIWVGYCQKEGDACLILIDR